ncbi:NAD(P)-dependent oxidoreductase, partial [Streptomyces sp. NPDC002130]|uniref:NAD(P)-dependent oxidoreductase n=1 Tax=Streptomyces sp. NPDC002130 TaxID=3155568 RepID=UPI00332AD88D
MGPKGAPPPSRHKASSRSGTACGPASRKESPVSAARKRVAVVGVGTMGSQAAWRLAARGAEVVGYDRFAPGHDRSAAGGETRVFRSVQT